MDDDDDDESEEEEEEVYEEESINEETVNPTKPHHQAVKVNGRQPKELITKHDPIIAGMRNAESSKERSINSGNMTGSKFGISTPVYNAMKETSKRKVSQENKVRGNRVDKSTSEQVLDHRTRVLLLKMLNSGILSEVNGVISTGKEANVYYAKAGNKLEEVTPGTEFAIKIYKTTLNEFKNRSDYINGEFRFKNATKSNPRKFIKLWAEKETRNLKRMINYINVPQPIVLRENILIMKFVGQEALAAPILKNVPLTEQKTNELYLECCNLMRTLFQCCKLVHADLSEYNILYHKGHLVIIDVSQAVEYDHPQAMEFLRNDVNAISQFFKKRGVSGVLSPRELFDFITSINLEDEQVDKVLTTMMEKALEREERGLTNDEKMMDALFQNTYIPRTLQQVLKPEQEIFDHEPSFHGSVTGLTELIHKSSSSESDVAAAQQQ